MSIAPVAHPMAEASLVEVMDYLALRLSDAKHDFANSREICLASDRFDEAYMWAVAAIRTQEQEG